MFNKKSCLFLSICLILVVNLVGCSSGNFSHANEKVSLSELHFDTIMNISLYGDNKEELTGIIRDSYARIDDLEKIFSAQLESSELYAINQAIARGEESFTISDELEKVIKYGLDVNEISNGALDITIGNLIDLWGIGTDHENLPTSEAISEALVGTGCSYLSLDEDNNELRVYSNKVKIDLGAIAKGYAADDIKSLILSKNSKVTGILDFGGNIMTIGGKTDGSKWKVGITDPFDNSNVYGGVSVSDLCVVTSGNYERYFEKDGVRYHHILDAKTGFPAKKGLVSVSIIGSSSIQCDALSTACFCLGADDALSLINGIDGVECVLIYENGDVAVSDGIGQYDFVRAE